MEVKTGVPVQVVSPGANSSKVTVPVGLKPPLTVAVSQMEVPTGPPAEGVVAMVGVAWVMVTGSAAQAGADRGVVGVTVVGGDPVVGAHRASVVKEPEVALSGLPLSGLVEVNTGVPVQVVSPGANSSKVTVPVGLNPPVTVAVSLIGGADRPARRGRGRDGRGGLGDGHRLVRAGRS